jgi:hypothetical protein
MEIDEIRLLHLEGQMHALARAWLHTAAALEIQGSLEAEQTESSLLPAHWSGAPFESHAQHTLRYLVEQLQQARETRRRQENYRLTGRDD